MKVNRREFSAALLGAAAFPGELLDDFDQSPRRPSMLLLPDDPFSGIDVLKARLDAGQRPSEDMSGWALSWQLTRKNEFAERAIGVMRALPPAPKGSASRIWMQVVDLSLAFDWLYEHPAFDAALKDGLANRLVDSAAAVLALPEIYYRFLETEDEYFDYAPAEIPPQGRWRICGIHLPDGILQKVYNGNASRQLHISG